MSDSSPRTGGPSRRRSFNLSEKREHLAAYEAACENAEGGAYLRRHGLYSSLIFEWRRLRDAGLLTGAQLETPAGSGSSGGSGGSGSKAGRPSPEQLEIARLRRQLAERERRLATTETALEIMGKDSRSWSRSPRARTPSRRAGSADGDLHGVDRGRGLDPHGRRAQRGPTSDRDQRHRTISSRRDDEGRWRDR